MYTILLVEDEKIELDTMKNYVDWKSMGIDRVFTARGGRSALECINSEEPDILITDIQMPGMTGIDLVDIIRQEGHNCKVVFLTGFDKFEYAKEAIRLQVEEFLLKPFQIDEVETVVRRLIEKIETERREKEFNKLALGKLLEAACNGEMHDLEKLSEYYFRKPAELVSVNILAFAGLSEENRQKLFKSDNVLHAFPMDPLTIAIFPSLMSVDLLLQRVSRHFPEDRYQVIHCGKPVKLSELQSACEKIKVCEDDLFYASDNAVFHCDDHMERLPYEDRIKRVVKKHLVLEAILVSDAGRAKEFLLQCLDSFTDMQKGGCCQNAFSLFLYLHRQMDHMGNLDGGAAVPNILRAATYEKLKDSFQTYVSQCCEFSKAQQTSKWSSYVQEFVMQHYMEDCTVEEMADGMNVTPNYLRRKFKEEAGMTILEYVTETRLNIAARMLEEGSRKVKDVSIAVGYPNISYFTQLFSRKYGVTPNEYKKNV